MRWDNERCYGTQLALEAQHYGEMDRVNATRASNGALSAVRTLSKALERGALCASLLSQDSEHYTKGS